MPRQVICILIFIMALIANDLRVGAAMRGGVSVSGKVLQANSKPLGYTEIELVPIDSAKQVNDRRLLATTSVSGLFSFAAVPAGKYTLSINFDEKPSETSPYPTYFYPNTADRAAAEIFDIDSASKVNGLIFQLPPKLVQRKITGKVIGTNGKPVADVFVNLKDIEYDDLSFAWVNKTDKNGIFKFNGFENPSYYIAAMLFTLPSSDNSAPGEPLAVARTDRFVLNAENADFIIKLKYINGKKGLLDNNVGMLILDY